MSASPATANRGGYWLVGSDGHVYAFGAARIYRPVFAPNKTNKKLDAIVGIVPTPDGGGYWLVGSDGGVYAYGDAHNFGSLPAQRVYVRDIVGIAATPNGAGYWLVGADGHVYGFGNAHALGP